MPSNRNLFPPVYSKDGYTFYVCYDLEKKMWWSEIFEHHGESEGHSFLRDTPEEARDDAIALIKERAK